MISGGSSDLRTKARRWDEREMTQLKERKEQLSAELRVSPRTKSADVAGRDQITSEISWTLSFDRI